MKEMQVLHTENYKNLLREIKEDLNKWRDISWSWNASLNIIKNGILIYRFVASNSKLAFLQKLTSYS